MGRRSLKSIEDYSRALKDGRGLGAGADYLPWIRVNDASSKGKSVKIYGLKTDRTHHLLSGIEESFFYCAEFDQRVVDIREQFPLLPLDLILDIANKAGLSYPHCRSTKDPYVLSTDFVLTMENHGKRSYRAVAIKPADELKNVSVLKRLEIERLFWVSIGCEWKLVTDKNIDKQVVTNVKWLSHALRDAGSSSVIKKHNERIGELISLITPGVYEWSGLVSRLAIKLNLDIKDAALLLKAAIWKKCIMVDLTTPIQEQYLVHVTGVTEVFESEDESVKVS